VSLRFPPFALMNSRDHENRYVNRTGFPGELRACSIAQAA
jgi:hypothetical protein